MMLELSWQNLIPEMVINNQRLLLKSGGSTSFNLSQERHCVGYKELGVSEYVLCPARSMIPSGKDSQCEFCKQKDISFTAKTGYGLSKQAGELLGSDHVVYLAYFSDDTIKVGVALWDRREIRVSEQGAVACLFIARGNGTVARNFERRIHTNVGLTEWVRIEAKLKTLGSEPDETRVRKSLINAYDKVKDITPSTVLFDKPDYVYLLQRYDIQPSVYTSDITLIREVRGGAVICGDLVGIYGKILLIQINNDTYAVNSQLLCGFNLQNDMLIGSKKWLHGVATKRIAIDRQQSLLDFL